MGRVHFGGSGPGASTYGPSRPPGGGLVADAGDEDPEHPASSRASSIDHLQARLTALTDDCVAAGLLESLRIAHRWTDVRRIQEISDDNCSHEWLWALDPNKGPVLSHTEYLNAVRLRLGAGGLDDPVVCGNCDSATLDPSAAHALCCARGPSTTGHYQVRDKLFEVVCGCDPGAETEPLGLIASHPALRPADILTSAAISGRLAALDVGIVAPEASGSGLDCTPPCMSTSRHATHPTRASSKGATCNTCPWSGARSADHTPKPLPSYASSPRRLLAGVGCRTLRCSSAGRAPK